MKSNSKQEAAIKLAEFFGQMTLNPRKIKQMKTLAMKHRIGLGEYRKRFCKKCYASLDTAKKRIRNNRAIVMCPGCGYISRYSL